MSDEVMTTCQQCGRLMVAPGGYLCDHARYWPDRASLESQNQALQERIDSALDIVTGHYGLVEQHTDADRLRLIGEVLSPTQETDPG